MGPGATALTRIPLLGVIICARPLVNCRMAPCSCHATQRVASKPILLLHTLSSASRQSATRQMSLLLAQRVTLVAA